MSRLDDITRELNLIRREVGLARSEADASARLAESLTRRLARLNLAQEDVNAGWRRLTPDVRPDFWDPRAGRHEDQSFGTSLQDRLSSGGGGSTEGVTGADQASLGRNNLLLDPLVSLPAASFTVPSVERILAYGWDHNFYGGGEAATLASWYAFAVSGSPNVGVYNAGYDFSPFSSAVFVSQHSGSAEARIRSASTQIGLSSGAFTARFLAGRIAYAHLFADTGTPTLKQLIIELYDATSSVVRASQTLSLLNVAVGTLGWLDVNYEPTASEKTHNWQLRLRVKTTGGTLVNFWLGDPMLVYSVPGSVPDVQPKIGRATSFPRVQHHNTDATQRTVVESWRQNNRRFMLYDDGTLEWSVATGAPDLGLERRAAKLLAVTDGDVAEGNLGAVGDLIPALEGASWSFTYNGDGTIATATRSGAAGSATTTITYAAGEITSIVTVKAGLTITTTPTYSLGKITGITRAVA